MAIEADKNIPEGHYKDKAGRIVPNGKYYVDGQYITKGFVLGKDGKTEVPTRRTKFAKAFNRVFAKAKTKEKTEWVKKGTATHKENGSRRNVFSRILRGMDEATGLNLIAGTSRLLHNIRQSVEGETKRDTAINIATLPTRAAVTGVKGLVKGTSKLYVLAFKAFASVTGLAEGWYEGKAMFNQQNQATQIQEPDSAKTTLQEENIKPATAGVATL